MSLFTGKVVGTTIKKLRRFTKYIGMGKFDTKEHRVIGQWGDESVPIEDCVAIWAHSSVSGENVVIGYINHNAVNTMNPGERRIFSTDSDGVEQVQVYLTDDGDVRLGGDADNLIRYSEMKAAFDQLKSDVNNMVTSFNSHTHAGVTVGTGITAIPTPTQSASTADMTSAKIDELKCS